MTSAWPVSDRPFAGPRVPGGERQAAPRRAAMSRGRFIARARSALQRGLTRARLAYLRRVWGMTLGDGVRISGKARLDYTHPTGLHIGDHTIITPGVQIFTHDFVGSRHLDTRIGRCCFIGAGAIILPGTTIGDHCVVAAGSVVTRDVPAHSVVAGNPASVIRSGIATGFWGVMIPNAPGMVPPAGDAP